MIRQVKVSDLPHIVQIENESFTDPYPERLLRTLAMFYPKTFVVATIGDELVGYASAILEEKQFAHLLSIAVASKFRKNGIGKKLLTTLISSTKKQSSRGMKLEVSESNQVAISLYRSLGFSEQRMALNYYPDGADALVMVLKW